MSDLDVRIVKLPPMRVACVNGFGEGPEGMAFDKMRAWAEAHHLLGKPYRLFGYNNPDPSPGSPNYGYDVWITVDESVQADGDARIIDFPGGLYAVTRIEVKNPWDDIPGDLAETGQVDGGQQISSWTSPVAGGAHRSAG